jgi:hypothetical protein
LRAFGETPSACSHLATAGAPRTSSKRRPARNQLCLTRDRTALCQVPVEEVEIELVLVPPDFIKAAVWKRSRTTTHQVSGFSAPLDERREVRLIHPLMVISALLTAVYQQGSPGFPTLLSD